MTNCKAPLAPVSEPKVVRYGSEYNRTDDSLQYLHPAVSKDNPPICYKISIAIVVVTDLEFKKRIALSEAPIDRAIKTVSKVAVAELVIKTASRGIATLQNLRKFATTRIKILIVDGPMRK